MPSNPAYVRPSTPLERRWPDRGTCASALRPCGTPKLVGTALASNGMRAARSAHEGSARSSNRREVPQRTSDNASQKDLALQLFANRRNKERLCLLHRQVPTRRPSYAYDGLDRSGRQVLLGLLFFISST